MPNEQTSVPLFTAGEVLTAANMNISAGTGVPVFANTTTRDAAFGGAGEKVLAEGQLCYLSSTNVVQQYNGSSWETVGPSSAGGLVCVKAETAFSAVSSVTADSVFTSAYTNYKIIMNYTTSTTGGTLLKLRVGGVSASTNYNAFYAASQGWTLGTVLASTSFLMGDYSNGAFNCNQITEIQQPAIATGTTIWNNATTSRGTYGTPYPQYTLGNHSTATAYDGVEILTVSGTMSGTYTIYGYAKTV
jgi:hypothetical protein